jgi:hypothetical protein
MMSEQELAKELLDLPQNSSDPIATMRLFDQKIVEYLFTLLEASGGTVAKAELLEKLSFLEEGKITSLIEENAPDVRETTVAGIPCWQRIELPANFAEHLKEAAANLERLGFALSLDNLNLALSLRYDKNFRRDYSLEDSAAFKKLLTRFAIGINQRKAKMEEASIQPVFSDEKHKDIARIDQESKRSHGWYVRVRFQGKTHSKFFSDRKCGSRENSLKAAVEWRNETEENLGKLCTNRHMVTEEDIADARNSRYQRD